MDANAIAKQFGEHYYNCFDTDRSTLSCLYRDDSMLTWEGQQFLGAAKISEKLTELPFAKVQHKVNTIDAQPSGTGLLIFITGLLVVDDSTNPLQFSQVFQLMPNTNEGGFWVYNDIFRLNYG